MVVVVSEVTRDMARSYKKEPGIHGTYMSDPLFYPIIIITVLTAAT